MQTLTVNNQNLAVKAYKGQRVVTFKDIDTVHQHPDGTAGRNFRINKHHFIEGEDYIRRISSDALREYNIASPNGLIVLTETGYLMLVKSFTDDLAWKVQRELVNNYFKPQNTAAQLNEPYEFKMKYYNGQQVVTITDIMQKLNISKELLGYHIHKLQFNVDYYLLSGEELT